MDMRRRRLAAIATAVTAVVMSLVAVQKPAGASPVAPVADRQSPVPATRASDSTASISANESGSCAATKAKLIAAAKAKGSKSATCAEHRPASAPKTSVRPPKLLTSMFGLPDFCFEHQFDGWWNIRLEACR